MRPNEALEKVNEICRQVDVSDGSGGMKWVLKAVQAGEGDLDRGIGLLLARAIKDYEAAKGAIG